MDPILFFVVASQQKAPSLAVCMSQILPDQLLPEGSLKIGQCPTRVRNLHLYDCFRSIIGRREPDVGAISIGYLFFSRHQVDTVRPLSDSPGKRALHLRLVFDSPECSPV
jgi:hypothetical protein